MGNTLNPDEEPASTSEVLVVSTWSNGEVIDSYTIRITPDMMTDNGQLKWEFILNTHIRPRRLPDTQDADSTRVRIIHRRREEVLVPHTSYPLKGILYECLKDPPE